MAWMLRGYVDVAWVPEGTGGITVMPVGGLGNEPAFAASLAAGPAPNAQTIRFQVAEPVTGSLLAGTTSGTLSTNLGTAASQLGTDLTTFLQNTANLAVIFGWASGSP